MTTLWLEAITAFFAGYIAATVSESLQHRLFGHGSAAIRKRTHRLQWMRKLLDRIYWSHTVIHHGRTFKQDFLTLFRTPGERAALLDSMTADEQRTAVTTHFGLTIPFDSYPWFLWLPLLAAAVLGWLFGPFTAAVSVLPMLVPPLLSQFIHPLIHKPYEDALAEAKGICKWVLASRYGRAMIRHHWMHHRYPRYNFNLLLLGDTLLGTHRRPSEKDLRDMAALGIPLD
jgi:hypothetical protein